MTRPPRGAALTAYVQDLYLRQLTGTVSHRRRRTTGARRGGAPPVRGSRSASRATVAASAGAGRPVRHLVLPVSADRVPGGGRDPAGSSSGLPTCSRRTSPPASTWPPSWCRRRAPSPPPTARATCCRPTATPALRTSRACWARTPRPGRARPACPSRSRTPLTRRSRAARPWLPSRGPARSPPRSARRPSGRRGPRSPRRTAARWWRCSPSTGNILAIANNAQFNDFALTAAVAPGSVMKIITASALIDGGLASEASPVACPPVYTVRASPTATTAASPSPRHAAVHRLRAVLQQRVRPVVAAAERAAGVHRADVLRP